QMTILRVIVLAVFFALLSGALADEYATTSSGRRLKPLDAVRWPLPCRKPFASASPRGWGSTEIRGSTPCKAEPRRGQWFLASAFIARTNAEPSRRRAMASAV